MEDYLSQANRLGRDEFARLNPFYFLFSVDPLAQPRGRHITDVIEILQSGKTGTSIPKIDASTRDDDRTPVHGVDEPPPPRSGLMLALRKTQPGDPRRLMIGRVAANDLVIPDSEVSRVHAFLEVRADHILLGDAGSSNGTMVNGRLLEARGQTQLVIPGDRIRIALLEFELLDAASAWERVQQLAA